MGFPRTYIHKYWKPFSLAVICLMLEAFCDLLQPTIMSKIVDIGVAGKKVDYVLQMGALMLGVTAFGALAAVSRNIVSSRVSQRFGAELRSDLFKKIHSFSFENIDRFEAASLVTRLTNDVTQVQNFVNGLMRIFVKAPLLSIGSLVMAFLLNPRMALVLVVLVPIIGALVFTSTKVGYPYFIRVQKSMDRVNGVMREYLAGVRVVKAFNRFDYEETRFAEANQELSATSMKAMRVMVVFSPAMTLVINLGIITVLWLGGWQVNNGTMHVGQTIAFINYMTQMLGSLMMISWVFNMFVRAKASTERISEVLTTENSMPISAELIELPAPKGLLEFDEVSFAYTGSSGEPVLKEISLCCPPGQTLGIIGSTGAGKTSLANLIPRFYDATGGAVRVDGVNVRDTDPCELRERIAIVPQKAVLFTGTIMENIRWGRENATEQDVEDAAMVAQAHEFITNFPEGYDTLLGQGGVNLSGGQKQRISIARALVRKPQILILDDCTSAVDVTTEANIREALKTYSSSLTCIVIAQRITSVMGAEKILVLDNGAMIGIGTHGELMQACEVYRDIFRSQIGKEEDI